jgi:hypothetical protein
VSELFDRVNLRLHRDDLHVFQLDWPNVGFNFSVRQLIEKTPLVNRMIDLLQHADLGVTGARAEEHPITLPEGLLSHQFPSIPARV